MSGTRTEEEIARLRRERGGFHILIRAIHRRRPLLTAAFVVAAPAYSLAAGIRPFDMIGPDRSWRFFLAWSLVLIGFAVRLWGSGNLHKNEELTTTGIYRIVRHPLYFGSLAFLLAYFVTVTDPLVGGLLFIAMVVGVYYPTMMSEETYLKLKFPEASFENGAPPRLIPDPRRIPEAIRTDRFNLKKAWGNLGFRSAWFILILPLFLRFIGWVQNSSF